MSTLVEQARGEYERTQERAFQFALAAERAHPPRVMTDREVRNELCLEALRIINDVQELDMTTAEFVEIMVDVLINGIPDPDQPAVTSVVTAEGSVLVAEPRL